jgi:hypothetical protein
MGVGGLGKVFCCTFGLINNERQEGFDWLMDQVTFNVASRTRAGRRNGNLKFQAWVETEAAQRSVPSLPSAQSNLTALGSGLLKLPWEPTTLQHYIYDMISNAHRPPGV